MQKIWFCLFLVSCGFSTLNHQTSHDEAAVSEQKNLMFLQVDMADQVSVDLARVISEKKLDAQDRVVLVLATQDVELLVDNSENLELASVKNRTSASSKSSSARTSTSSSRSSSTAPTSSTRSMDSQGSSKDLSKKPSLLSKIFSKDRISEDQKKISSDVPKEQVLKQDQIVYQGAYIPTGMLRERMLRGFEAPKFDIEGGASYQGKHVYSTASLKVTTAVLQADSIKQGDFSRGKTQVVFKMKVRSEQGVAREVPEQQRRDLKLVDIYGRVAADQILGFYYVRNGDIVDFVENSYQSKTKRTITKVRDRIESFVETFKERVLEEDDVGSSSSLRPVRVYNPNIPGTAVSIGSLKHR